MKIFKMETKKLALWLVIIFGASALISGASLWASGLPESVRNGEEWPPTKEGNGNSINIDESRTFPVDGLSEIQVDLSFENAAISGIDGDEITVRYYGTARPARDVDDVFFTEESGGVLTLESRWGGTSVRDGRIVLELGIPAGSNLSLKFDGGSGNLDTIDLSLSDLDARMGSGNMEIVDLQTGSATLKLGSGNITAEDWNLDSGSLEAGSGNLKLTDIRSTGRLGLDVMSGVISGDDISASMIEGHAGSGNIRLKNVSGSFGMKSGSGNLDVEFLAPGNEIEAGSGSGRVELGLPAGTEFTLDARTGSGNIKSDFPITVTGSMNNRNLEGVAGNGGSRTVKLDASSGNIVLKELL